MLTYWHIDRCKLFHRKTQESVDCCNKDRCNFFCSDEYFSIKYGLFQLFHLPILYNDFYKDINKKNPNNILSSSTWVQDSNPYINLSQFYYLQVFFFLLSFLLYISGVRNSAQKNKNRMQFFLCSSIIEQCIIYTQQLCIKCFGLFLTKDWKFFLFFVCSIT